MWFAPKILIHDPDLAILKGKLKRHSFKCVSCKGYLSKFFAHIEINLNTGVHLKTACLEKYFDTKEE